MRRVICESAEHYREVTLAQKSCQHPMDSGAQPELCGDGTDYCAACPACDRPFCDQHLVRFDDSELCFSCVRAEMAAEAKSSCAAGVHVYRLVSQGESEGDCEYRCEDCGSTDPEGDSLLAIAAGSVAA